MATTPLNDTGSITNSEECWGQNLFRDNTGNGNLVLISNYTVLDMRVSTDDGVTWTEPTGMSDSENGTHVAWVQDSDGDFHGVVAGGTAELDYWKISVTRTSGDITSVSASNLDISGQLTNDLEEESIGIGIVSDKESTAKERVAISWYETKTGGAKGSQNVWLFCTITTRSAGVSPSSTNDFADFAETAATPETVKTYTAGETTGSGNEYGASTKIEWIQSGTDIGDIYLIASVYDSTNTSARETVLWKAAINSAGGGAPYWGSFSSATTASRPAAGVSGRLFQPDMRWDSTNSYILIALQDTTSTSSTTVDFWTVNTSGTISKTPAMDGLSLDNAPELGVRFGWDSNNDIWLVAGKNFLGQRFEVAQYKSSSWTNWVYRTGSGALPEAALPTIVASNTGDRVFLTWQGAVNADYNVLSINITSLTETLQSSGGTYDDANEAMNKSGVPDLMPYDYTLTIHHKSGGWTDAIDFQHDSETRFIASGVTCTIKANASEAFNDSSATVPGKWDTGRVYLTGTFFTGDGSGAHVLGTGTMVVSDLQSSNYFNAVAGSALTLKFEKCLSNGAFGSFNCYPLHASCDIQINNCAARASTSGVCFWQSAASVASTTLDSCTAYNAGTASSDYGFRNLDTTNAMVATNCLSETATSTSDNAFAHSGGGWGASDYNIAGGPAASNDAPGVNSTVDQSSAQLALVDPANGDLRIGSGSTAIDAGSTALTTDVLGTTRVATDDCGFYDYDANNPAGPAAGLRTLGLTGAGI